MQLSPFFADNYDKIDWSHLSRNPNAIGLLEQNQDKINWDWLGTNPNALPLLEQNIDKIDWGSLSQNPNAIDLLTRHFDNIEWDYLAYNPGAIDLLKANPDKINWAWMSRNPNAIELLEANPDKIDWSNLFDNSNCYMLGHVGVGASQLLTDSPSYGIGLCHQPTNLIIPYSVQCDVIDDKWRFNMMTNHYWYMIQNPDEAPEFLARTRSGWSWLSKSPELCYLLEPYIDKIDWIWMAENPNGMHFVEQHLDRIRGDSVIQSLSENPHAIHILEQNPELICWSFVWSNPAIFEEVAPIK